MSSINIVDHHIGQLRNALKHQPPSREVSIALTKLDEFEMWLARLGPDGLIGVNPSPVANEVAVNADMSRWFEPGGDWDSPVNKRADNIFIVDSLDEFLGWARSDKVIAIKVEAMPVEWRVKVESDRSVTEYRTGNNRRFGMKAWTIFCNIMDTIVEDQSKFLRLSECWVKMADKKD